MNKNGFTLIEMMVAIVIVGVLFGTVVTATNGINRRSRDSHRQTDIQKIQSALQEYYADNHFYPETSDLTSAGGILTTGGPFVGPAGRTYLGDTPQDPGGSPPYCYLSQVAQNVIGGCDNAVDSTNKCEYYQLCASLEDPQAGSIPCTCNGATYNLSVRSP